MQKLNLDELYAEYLQGKALRPGDAEHNAQVLDALIDHEWDTWTAVYADGFHGYAMTDGQALAVIRDRIVRMRRDAEKQCGQDHLPAAFRRGVPDRVPDWYMARPQQYALEARDVLERMAGNPDVCSLRRTWNNLTDEELLSTGHTRSVGGKRVRCDNDLIAAFDRMRKTAKCFAADVDAGAADMDWVERNAESLFELREYARRADHTVQYMASETRRIKRAVAGGAHGKHCLGYEGLWCGGCDACRQ